MSERIEPLGDRIIVRPIEEPTVTAGGVHLPDMAKERPQRGEVLGVGPGHWDPASRVFTPIFLEEGEVVLYSKYAGTELPDGLLVIREADVLGVVREEPGPRDPGVVSGAGA